TYICPKCGFTIDRDLNAAINLKNSLKSDYVGRVTTEFMDVDRLALLDYFAKNKITTSLIEASIQ
ncbi:MAG: zinc ribbon domain-containing protein, partial [Succinivibrionaceae bacterium]|nr:zinc ribbon domain-containing protein [Succinivibrionaceae bacterium]